MFFPVGDDNVVGGYKPYFSYLFLFINVLVFVYQLTLPEEEVIALWHSFGAIPQDIVAGNNYFTMFTNMFLHGGFMHIFFNMLFLWIFADNIEAKLGNLTFALFYIVGGLFASCSHVLSDTLSILPSIGASGAIAACLGAYMVLFPNSKIRIRFLLFKPFVIKAIVFLGIYITVDLFAGISSLATGPDNEGGTAYWAHIGGFAFGLVIGFLFKRFYTEESPMA